MNKLILAYMGFNLFFSGIYFGGKYKWNETKAEKVYDIIVTILLIFFGLPSVLYSLIPFNKINQIIPIKFLFYFYFTKRYNNIEKHKLSWNTRVCLNNKNTNSIQDRVYRYCVKMVNKRNNYVHEELTYGGK